MRNRLGIAGHRTIRHTVASLAAVLCLALPALPAGAGTRAHEGELTAVFLSKLIPFVAWPEKELRGQEEFVIGVYGDKSVERALRVATESTSVQGRPLIVRRIQDVRNAADCRVLFVAADEKVPVCDVIDRLPDVPVLTVGGFEEFCRRGGVMSLSIRNSRVTLSINPDSYARSGLSVSARLLQIAESIDQEECE